MENEYNEFLEYINQTSVIKKVDDVYFHRKYKTISYGTACKLFTTCRSCRMKYRLHGGIEDLKNARKNRGLCDDCRKKEEENYERIQRERSIIESAIKKLCEQPDIVNNVAVILLPSKDNKIKVSLARYNQSKNNFFESEIKEFDDYDQAKSIAINLATTINTVHVYEVRVFNDGSYECLRILIS